MLMLMLNISSMLELIIGNAPNIQMKMSEKDVNNVTMTNNCVWQHWVKKLDAQRW